MLTSDLVAVVAVRDHGNHDGVRAVRGIRLRFLDAAPQPNLLVSVLRPSSKVRYVRALYQLR